MRTLRSVPAVMVLAMLATACASPTPGAAEPLARAEPLGPTPPPAVQPTPAEPTTSPTPPTPAPPKLGRDHHSVVACSTDADCGWDDDCLPKRCVEASTTEVACDESGPPPGTCACLESACTLRPDSLPAPVGSCEPRACVVDRAGGKCVADDGGVAEGLRYSKPVDVGPSCDCIRPDEGCVFQWFEPVPCTSNRDCWISPSPRRHPIARPRALRKRDFRPCEDGEVAPQCGPAGHCVVGPAYSC